MPTADAADLATSAPAPAAPAGRERVADPDVSDAAPADDPSPFRSEESFAALVDEHGPAVYRLARSVVQDAALADDVTQDTFIAVWKHRDSLRDPRAIRSWILRIAHNTAVSTLRRVRDSATDPSRLPEHAAAIGTSRVVEGRIAAADLVSALGELDGLSREIVVLREVEGMSYDDIAQALEVPIPTVKTRLLRARRQLAVSLEGWKP